MTTPIAPLGARVTVVAIDNTLECDSEDQPCGYGYCDGTCTETPIPIDAIVTHVYDDDGAIDVRPIDGHPSDEWTLFPVEVARGEVTVHVTAVWAPAPVVLPELESVA